MFIHSWIARIGALAVGVVVAAHTLGQTPEPPLAPAERPAVADPTPEDGVEVLARGPLHEAFANPVNNLPQGGDVVAKEPPAAIEEMPPDQKPEGDDVDWMPGYWSWDDDRSDFIWISGFWRVPPPDRRWVPGHWNQVAGGYQWVGGFWAPDQDEEISYQAPPPEPLDNGPSTPAPSSDHTYVPGTWVWGDARYVWRPGCWVQCRPGWVWMPAHYVWTPCGYVFVDGYWDYPLADRGVLFAPVYIRPTVYVRPAFCYTPCYVVQDDFLFGAMWVRPGCSSYYFGDYFEARYSSCGYVSWCDYRVSRGCYDPLFSYYSWHHGPSSGWSVGIRGLYVGRFNGSIARPPRTLIQQNTVVNNVVINKNVNVINNNVHVSKVQNVTALSPLNKSKARLQTVSQEKRLEQRQTAQRLQEASKKRGQVERELVARGPGPNGPGGGPRVAKLDLPTKPAARKVVNPARTPPAPAVKPAVRPGVGRANPQPGPGPDNKPGPINPGVKPKPMNPGPKPGPVNPLPKAGPNPGPKPGPVNPNVKPPLPKPNPDARPPLPKANPDAKPPLPRPRIEGNPRPPLQNLGNKPPLPMQPGPRPGGPVLGPPEGKPAVMPRPDGPPPGPPAKRPKPKANGPNQR